MRKISIVLPCYNCETTIIETLVSIVSQTYKDYQLIVVNDGSTDSSLRIIKEFLNLSGVRYKVIDRENKGFLYSIIEAIDASSSNFIARIDADDVWKKDHLAIIMLEFSKDENLVLLGSQGEQIDSKSNVIGLYHKLPKDHDGVVKYLHKDNPFIHSSVVFSRKAYISAGGYLNDGNERNTHIAEYILWFEMSRIGMCKNLSHITVRYRVLESSLSRSMNLVKNYQARLFVMKKVANHYNNHKLFSWLSRLKVFVRIAQSYCTGKK
tara:strand:- start:2213 stop:3010 length:798 start_codon:yes stop_codon:yes gene_type:complete